MVGYERDKKLQFSFHAKYYERCVSSLPKPDNCKFLVPILGFCQLPANYLGKMLSLKSSSGFFFTVLTCLEISSVCVGKRLFTEKKIESQLHVFKSNVLLVRVLHTKVALCTRGICSGLNIFLLNVKQLLFFFNIICIKSLIWKVAETIETKIKPCKSLTRLGSFFTYYSLFFLPSSSYHLHPSLTFLLLLPPLR